jgi:hypothetical protein
VRETQGERDGVRSSERHSRRHSEGGALARRPSQAREREVKTHRHCRRRYIHVCGVAHPADRHDAGEQLLQLWQKHRLRWLHVDGHPVAAGPALYRVRRRGTTVRETQGEIDGAREAVRASQWGRHSRRHSEGDTGGERRCEKQ